MILFMAAQYRPGPGSRGPNACRSDGWRHGVAADGLCRVLGFVTDLGESSLMEDAAESRLPWRRLFGHGFLRGMRGELAASVPQEWPTVEEDRGGILPWHTAAVVVGDREQGKCMCHPSGADVRTRVGS